MPASKTSVTDAAIQLEIVKALRFFGASPETLAALALSAFPQPVLYKTFQRLGAKSDLLSIVGSWDDTMDDEWVLSALLEWNGRVRFISGRRPH